MAPGPERCSYLAENVGLLMDEVTTNIQGTARGRSEAPIRARILQAIFERRLPPGEKLTEDRLAELFGVSRTVVRQALSRLAQDGIVEHLPNRGAFVAAPSRADARHVLEARAVVEPEIAGAAACRCDAHALSRLRRHVETEDSARAGGDRGALVRLTGEFHVVLAESAGNPVFVRLLTELQALSSLSILLYARGEHSACPPDEHHRIVAAIERGDAEGAQQLMREHIAHVAAEMDLSEPVERPTGLAQALGIKPRAPRHR
ncbi:GntR family transcriptional regulator [Ancylobacter mangrovi]|uniref:GntR family transcriptional regulator n=1 Tax=Ancylobacter mangrovi TaxID=2972472 RepID=A0A9X2PE17_9HYPH|nr:GntR family transcriptional regulator [Ancylobacter mangrovi]MCS0495166.1 GntR family transcriptional regulator [Ancylobacter mangrovi]MCS0502560.1 GntR family transcriptional regulator [Ancylobacter mangrovi]